MVTRKPIINTLVELKREKRLLKRSIRQHDVVLQESAGKLPGYFFRTSISKIGKGYAILRIAKAVAPWAIGLLMPKTKTSFLAGVATDMFVGEKGGFLSGIKKWFKKKKS